MRKSIKSIIIIVLSLYATLMMNMNMDMHTAIEYSFIGNTITHVIIFAAMYFGLKRALEIKDKRLSVICTILAVAFTGFQIIGITIDTFLGLENLYTNEIYMHKSILKAGGYFIIFYAVLVNLLEKLSKFKPNDLKLKFFGNNKKTFFLMWGVIFVAWIPYLLNYFPGMITPDSMSQIMQSLGNYNLTNHHPVFHTLIISIFMNIGKIIGNYNIGIGLYSIAQMTIMSAIFAFTIYYMGKRNVDIRIRILSALYFAIYPIHAIYSMTMWKDILFGGAMILFTISMIEIVKYRTEFFKSKKKNIFLAISILLVLLLRNNGLYVVMISTPIIFFIARKEYKKLLIIFGSVFLIFGIIKGPIYSILEIQEGSTREALSVPLQQMARITQEHGDSLTQEQKDGIYKYLPVENLGELYYPKISDQVKSNFDDEAWENDKITFIKTWLSICIDHPITAVEAFIANSYGYWYPEAVHWVVAREVYEGGNEEEYALNIYTDSIVDIEILEKFNMLIDKRNIPVNSMIYSIGFCFWVVSTMLAYIIYKKEYKSILIFIPVGILWLTCLASPVYGEFRYIYSMFTCAPLLVGLNFMKKQEIKNDKEIIEIESKK